MDCELCKASGKPVLGGLFFILECRTCNVPMVVSREHRVTITEDERGQLELIRKIYFSGKKFRGYMRSITDHWHDHLI
jgi:hypothetical protein